MKAKRLTSDKKGTVKPRDGRKELIDRRNNFYLVK